MLKLKKERGSFGPIKVINFLFFYGKQKRCQTKTLFVEFICNKLRCYLKLENNKILPLTMINTLILR